MTYTAAIKRLRTRMMLTQSEFADAFGVKYGTVNRWEAGSFEPTMKTKRKLAPFFEKFNIKVEDE